MEESNRVVCVSSDNEKVVVGAQATEEKDMFECNICMDPPTNSVLTKCGHLFCWSCLHQWLQNKKKPCPVCKAMVTRATITPVYGCQGKSSSNNSIPPRPSVAPKRGQATASGVGASHSTTPSTQASNTRPVTLNVASLQRLIARQVEMESSMQDLYTEALRARAQADFREMRASHPPSPIAWIAEASIAFARAFDPSWVYLDGIPKDELFNFALHVVACQGEYIPDADDFRSSWWPYYEAQNPALSQREHYEAFMVAWGMHFWNLAWDKENKARTLASSGRRVPSSLEVGSTSIDRHQEPLHGSKSKVEEVDATEYRGALQERRASRQAGRPSGARNYRRRPY